MPLSEMKKMFERAITREQIDAIRHHPALVQEVSAGLRDPYLAQKAVQELSDEDWDNLHDACLDALINDAPDVDGFDAVQDKGAYHVCIRGIPGAYFVSALEYDDEGFFSTLEEAQQVAEFHYGEFRVIKE